MKLNSEWPRIAGIHADPGGQIGAVWLAHDKSTDTVYLYDSAVFSREVFAVIADRFKGPKSVSVWIPIAWEQASENVCEALKDRGCRPLLEGYKDSQAMAESVSREIWERMRAKTFVPASHNTKWFDESDRYQFVDGKIPMDGFPLMAATRHAVKLLKRAKANQPKRKIKYENAGII